MECLNEVAGTHSLLVTVEDNVVAGGAGSAVSEALGFEWFYCGCCNWASRITILSTGVEKNS